MLSNIGQEVVARFGISTPMVLAGPHTVIFQNKEESSCPHSYYARLQKKRIFVRKKTAIRQPFSMQLTIRENTEHLLHMLFVLFQKDQLGGISYSLLLLLKHRYKDFYFYLQ